MKILTFNHHESYLCSLAGTQHKFDVVTKYKRLNLSWNKASRDVPPNFRLVEFDQEIVQNLKNGVYDVVICHTIKNLLWLFPFRRTKYIFIGHIPLFFYSIPLATKAFFKKLLFLLFSWTHHVHFVAVSEFKRHHWGQKGSVIVLTPEEFPSLKQKEGYQKILVVCNALLNRKLELGFDMIEKIIDDGFPLTIVGNNPGAPNTFKPKDFAEFQEFITRFRIYLYTIQQPYGDGYNTAMLEVMNMGMAIVTIQNPSSPIKHNVNGLVGSNVQELIHHLNFLLNSPDEVDRLGKAAKQTIQDHFSKQRFLDGWNNVFKSLFEKPS